MGLPKAYDGFCPGTGYTDTIASPIILEVLASEIEPLNPIIELLLPLLALRDQQTSRTGEISSVRNDIILFPSTSGWIRLKGIVTRHASGHKPIVAYSPVIEERGLLKRISKPKEWPMDESTETGVFTSKPQHRGR
jgi:hypothetical protein